MSEEKKSSSDVLIDEFDVAGYKLHKWTLGDLSRLTPCFQIIGMKLKENGVTLDNFKDKIVDIIPCITDQLPELVAISTRTSVDDARKIDIDTAIILVMGIVKQNLSYLKNLSGPISALVKEMTSG